MLSQASFNKKLAYQYLSFLLNHKADSIQPINNLAPMPNLNETDIYNSNIDIQKAKLGLEVTGMAIKVQEANFLPTVGAFGEYGSTDNKPLNHFIDKDFYTVGVQLEWNLFNGHMDQHNLEKARVENMKVQEQIELAKKGTYLKINKLLTEAKSKDALVKNLQVQLDFASKVYRNYQERYKEGLNPISDVLVKQSKELEVLLKLLTAKNDRNAKIFEITSLTNKGEIQ